MKDLNNEKLDALLTSAKLLPLLPGVYKMLDKNGRVIYVGKSKALKNRVSQYFQNVDAHNYKTRKMVENVDRFECVFTDTETEALVLENELIKLFSPKFNIRLKDDKSYPYIMVSTSERYPTVKFVRSLNVKKKKNDKFFGPYSSSSVVYDIVDTVNKIFKLPTCKLKFPEDIGKKRPCLNYHINRCSGLCRGTITEEKYNETIKSVILFLRSEYEAVIKQLEVKMYDASEKLLFEEAAELRNLISSIKSLRQQQKVVFADSVERDVFGYYIDDVASCIAVSIIRDGRIIDSERFLFRNDEILDEHTFFQFIVEYYKNRFSFPKEIYVPFELNSEESISVSEYLSQLSQKKVRILAPEKGEGRKIVIMASENAKEHTLHERSVSSKTEEKLVELSAILQLEVVPERIEAYDISNSASEHTVAGMISIVDGTFSKKGYRLFNIRGSSLDDYSAMKEALCRRFSRFLENEEEWQLPDLILVDGGIGHVNIAKEALSEYGFDIPVFGMVKDEHHKTRTLVDGVNEISIAHNVRVFNFIYGIQEEVHRFTFASMDKKRRKTVSHLAIESIKGIGPIKAKALMKHFKSSKKIQNASFEELISVKEISERDARSIISFYENTNKIDE